MTMGIVRAFVEFFQRGDLRRGEATIGIAGLAEQNRGIEMALARVVEDAVSYAVKFVAGVIHGSGDSGQFLRGDVACGILNQGVGVPNAVCKEVRPKIRGSTGKDAVVIVRIALGF